jgi:hypothetical protein
MGKKLSASKKAKPTTIPTTPKIGRKTPSFLIIIQGEGRKGQLISRAFIVSPKLSLSAAAKKDFLSSPLRMVS